MAAPTPVELPALGSDAYFSEEQWEVLLSLIDTVVPSIVVSSVVGDEQHRLRIPQNQFRDSYEETRQLMKQPPTLTRFEDYLKARPLENKRFIQQLRRTVSNLPLHSKRQLGAILTLLT